MRIALAANCQIKTPVVRKELQHMVKKPAAGFYLMDTAPVQIKP
jgi:hypothetical protein